MQTETINKKKNEFYDNCRLQMQEHKLYVSQTSPLKKLVVLIN